MCHNSRAMFSTEMLVNQNCTLLSLTAIRRYVAAKGHYFGVGGSVLEFSDYVTQHGVFNVDSVWKTSEGLFAVGLCVMQQ